MQVLISTHSKSKHYNLAEPDADFTVGNGHDVIGLVWAICVKATHIRSPFMHGNPSLTKCIQAHSSAKWKQLFADLQCCVNMKPIRQLLIDMPVHWSSTYIMTSRIESMGGVSKLLSCHVYLLNINRSLIHSYMRSDGMRKTLGSVKK
jgi:hypothetical protein